jgi:ribonuclease BN (tRNA processing enzyme)
LNHPGGCLGYRIDCGGKSVCYLTDVEISRHQDDEALTAFVRNTDLLIMDSFFGAKQCISGWGHSSVDECTRLANQSGAGRLALFHYSHTCTDDDIAAMERTAKDQYEKSFAPEDGYTIMI